MLRRRHLACTPSARRLAGAGLLALALLWAQLLGLAHGLRHALPAHGGAAAEAQAQAQAQAAPGLLGHLAAPAHDGPECRLYDQIGQGGLLPALPALAAALPALALPLLPLRGQPAAPCAVYAARAPPVSR